MPKYTETIIIDENTGESITIEADSLAELDRKVDAALGEESRQRG